MTSNPEWPVYREYPPVLNQFPLASLELLDKRLLQDRVDSKYLLPIALLEPFLSYLLDDEYAVLPSAGHLAATYRTLYFDTPDRKMYEDHIQARKLRHKVRIRHYLERKVAFLEIKTRRLQGGTVKARKALPFGTTALDAEAILFIEAQGPAPARNLAPQVVIECRRATLLAERVNERVTVDWNVALRKDGRRSGLVHEIIVEVKRHRCACASPAVAAMEALRLHEQAVSKYCLAVAKLEELRRSVLTL